MSDLTTISNLPGDIRSYLNCSLIHSRVPKFTGKFIWDEKEENWKREIIWVCKECNGIMQ